MVFYIKCCADPTRVSYLGWPGSYEQALSIFARTRQWKVYVRNTGRSTAKKKLKDLAHLK